ncbi:MAG TPA: LPS assembly protein LptD [Chthoniobacterales bacterium]|jgi:lipopolysaccharide export system protein LptA|nr:LPS assembly protein LptD [Chthoniobacterales bacterium]
MRKPVFLLLLLLVAARAGAQDLEGPGSLPIEITSTGETTYENGIATARDNVAIRFGDTDIYADFAQYDTEKRTIFLKGNVRIYRGATLYMGEQATYNLESKAINADQMRTGTYPYLIAGQSVASASDEQYLVQHGTFTTHDSEKPDFHLNAHTVRIYPDDRVVLKNVTFYIGQTPVFWWPYLYQSLDRSFSYSIAPAYLSSWGPSLLGQITFPIGEKITSTVKFDYRSRRGPALGFDSDIRYGKNDGSIAKLTTYYLQDQNPDLNRTSLPRQGTPTSRYRFSLQNRTQITDDLDLKVDITKLSDRFLLQDFFPGEFRINPEPDNVVALTKTSPFYTLTAYTRWQFNSFFETTERLPEVALDIKRHGLFGGPIFYEGETSVGELRRNFPANSIFEDYDAFRIDSFHQLTYPNTYFGWLALVPRVGFRETYYSQTHDLNPALFPATPDPLAPEFPLPNPQTAFPSPGTGETFRSIFNAGIEGSFKISRAWDEVQTRALGLDGLRHIIQPFFNLSYVSSPNVDPATILQFDRVQPSTKLNPIDFPQYTSIDAIDNWTIARIGVRNRLQTRRDDLTVSWLELETYVDVNFDNPFDKTDYSNVFNRLRFTPVPWATLVIESQIPLLDDGFTEVNTSINFQPTANTVLTLGHRYLEGNPLFLDSSLFTVGGYYRLNDNWGFGFLEQYEANTNIVEQQRYSIYRDLTSWVGSLGAIIRNNGGVKEYGVLLTFTLKAFPKFGLDLNFDPAGTNQGQ